MPRLKIDISCGKYTCKECSMLRYAGHGEGRYRCKLFREDDSNDKILKYFTWSERREEEQGAVRCDECIACECDREAKAT